MRYGVLARSALAMALSGTTLLAYGADFWYPRHGFFADPWNTRSQVPAFGTYSEGRFGLPSLPLRHPPEPARLQQLRSLPAITDWALQHNPKTAAAWDALEAQASALGVAKGLWLPTISAQVQGQRGQTVYSQGFSAPPLNGLYNTLSLSEELFNFGYRRTSIAKAEAATLVNRLETDITIQQVALNVANTYYGLAEARADVRIYRSGVRQARQIEQDTRSQYRAHLKPITDNYQAQNILAEEEESLAAAEGSERSARGALAEAAGLPVASRLQVFSPQISGDQILRPIQHWLRVGLLHNPSILADLASAREARRTIGQAEAQGLPSVSLVGDIGRNLFRHVPNERSFSIGLQINIPFDSNFSTTYQVQEDRALYREARANTQAEAQSILLNLWQAYVGLRSAHRAEAAVQAQVKSAQKALLGIRTQYRIGLANILELTIAEENLISARITRAQILAQYYQDRAALFSYAGMAPQKKL